MKTEGLNLVTANSKSESVVDSTYKALDREGNLHEFRWGEDDKFYILENGIYKLDDASNYEVVQVSIK